MNTWQKLKTNPSLWSRYFLRERLVKQIRLFFDARGFHEVETPILIAHPAAESYLDVFTTELLDRKRNPTPVYLSTSPELALKKLLVAGIGNCYSITKSFRNTEMGDVLHSPEFTILEWYRVAATYKDIMSEIEQFILSLCPNPATPVISYQGKKINLSPPWERLSVKEAFQRYAHVDFEAFFDMKNARTVAKSKGYAVTRTNTWEELYNQIFLNEVEPHVGQNQPTFLYDFPKDVGALAKIKKDDLRFVERFELYIGGLELADCYTELTDWKEQKARFDKEMSKVKKLGKTSYMYDRDFINAMKAGLPDCSGIAVGVDRLIMLFADTKNIADVMFFPAEELL